MATSGTVQSASCSVDLTQYGMRWEFRWTASPSAEPGVTTISWELWTVGKSATPAYAVTEITLEVTDHNDNQLLKYASGSSSRDFSGVLQDSGSFNVTHDTDGFASFTVKMTTDIYEGVNRTASGTGTLDTNVPYYYVYIDTGKAFVKAIPHIYTGSEWKVATAYIDNGSKWVSCT